MDESDIDGSELRRYRMKTCCKVGTFETSRYGWVLVPVLGPVPRQVRGSAF
jgi:hypothetical protein